MGYPIEGPKASWIPVGVGDHGPKSGAALSWAENADAPAGREGVRSGPPDSGRR